MPKQTLTFDANRLQEDCAEAYQAVGVLADALGYWGMAADDPNQRQITKFLDNLGSAAQGDPRLHADQLPFAFTPVSPRLRWPLWRPISEAPEGPMKADLWVKRFEGHRDGQRLVDCWRDGEFWLFAEGRIVAHDGTITHYMPIPEGPK